MDLLADIPRDIPLGIVKHTAPWTQALERVAGMKNFVMITESIIEFPRGILIRDIYSAPLAMENEFFVVATEGTPEMVNTGFCCGPPETIYVEAVSACRARDWSEGVTWLPFEVPDTYRTL